MHMHAGPEDGLRPDLAIEHAGLRRRLHNTLALLGLRLPRRRNQKGVRMHAFRAGGSQGAQSSLHACTAEIIRRTVRWSAGGKERAKETRRGSGDLIRSIVQIKYKGPQIDRATG